MIRNIHKIVISKRIDVQRRAWNHFEEFFQQITNLLSSKEKEVDFSRERAVRSEQMSQQAHKSMSGR